MQIDLRTVGIEAKRQTFTHIERRIGKNKPATRYQEGTFDLQSTVNFHYAPSWDPEHELYDVRRTAVVMRDWYDLKDSRQFYYGAYTAVRARQNEAVDASFDFVESRHLADIMPEAVVEQALAMLMPLRHLGWGANQNNMFISAYGYGAAITQATTYHAMDNLGIAQFLTRIGLLLGDQEALHAGKSSWLTDPAWQGVRRHLELNMAKKDWFEVHVAHNVVLDGLLYPLVYEHFVDVRLSGEGGAPIAMLTSFMADWFKETGKWLDAVTKVVVAESEANRELVSRWVRDNRKEVAQALLPLARRAFPDTADAVMESVLAAFDARMAKTGVVA